MCNYYLLFYIFWFPIQTDWVQGVQLVPEELLEVAKSKYHGVTSCHIYSVQKAKLKVNTTK